MRKAAQFQLSLDGTHITCKPFLKWAGGKTQLLPQLLSRVPTSFGRYYEPFLGGGALLHALQPRSAFVSDINHDLVNCYEVVRDEVERLIVSLRNHRYESEHFYRIRNSDRSATFARWSKVRRASRFIFLNKTCFNGLYRVNSKGHFNVPFGRYDNPTILDTKNLRACSEMLSGVSIQQASFLEFERKAKRGDFVYFDPPYVPLSATSSFTSYSADGFGSEMQRELFRLCTRLDRRGVKFMLSNSSAPLVSELYRRFRIERVPASRAINSKSSERGKVMELIVRNY